MGTKRFSGLAVLFSLIGAGIAYLIGEGILRLTNGLPDYLKVGLYFGTGAMILSIMILVSQKISPQLLGYRWKEQYFKTSLKLWIPTTLLIVGLSAGLLQFVYGLEINEPKLIENIVIAVDRSSSMDTTDPDGERFNAMSHFIDYLEGKKNIALMTFNEEPSLMIDFTPVSTDLLKEKFKKQVEYLEIKNDGQTGIRKVMNEAYNLIGSDEKRASVILISDGAPTDGSDENIKELVQDYVNTGIPVYTIGMMYANSESEAYLQEIAALTGGTYYSTSDVTMINEVFSSIRYEEEKGTIISPRTGAYTSSALHKVFRILFLTGIALMMALGMGMMFDNKYLVKGMLVGMLVGGLIGGALSEYLFIGELYAVMVRLVYWIFIGLSAMSFTWCITFKDTYRRIHQAS